MTFPEPFPHGELQPAFTDIHVLVGSVSMGPGVRIARMMAVLVHEGELTLVNAIRPDDAGRQALDALGRVAHVVKIGTHGMDDPWYVETYGATRWALPEVELEGPVERLAEDHLPVPWLELFRYEQPTKPEAALIADRDGGVLITCDSVQSWPDLEQCSLLAKPVTVLMGFTKRPAVIGPPWLKMVTPEGGSLKSDFDRLLERPFRHLIGGHGKPLRDTAKDELTATVAATFA